MKWLTIVSVFVVFSSSLAIPVKSSIEDDLTRFNDESMVQAHQSYRQLFDAAESYCFRIAAELRVTYENFAEARSRFPFDSLTAETRRSLEMITGGVGSIMNGAIYMAEERALRDLWWNDPDTGERAPTPAEFHMMDMGNDIEQMKKAITVADPQCLGPLLPQIIPGYQPFVNIIVNAALDIVPTVPDRYIPALAAERTNDEATNHLISYLNLCGGSIVTETCIRSFVSYLNLFEPL